MLEHYLDKMMNTEFETGLPLNCVQGSVYNIVKIRIPDIKYKDVCHLFLDNLSFSALEYPDGKIGAFKHFEAPIEKKLTLKEFLFDESKSDPVKFLDDLLDKNGPLLVQTNMLKILFYKYYDPSGHKFVPGHVFLVIGHDDSSYYIKEVAELINYDHFYILDNNSSDKNIFSLGKIEKAQIKDAFESYLKCFTVEMDEKGIYEPDVSRIKGVIMNSVEGYKKGIKYENGITYYQGREAIKRLVDLTLEGSCSLKDVGAVFGHDFYRQLVTNYDFISGRRRVLADYINWLTENKGICNDDMMSLASLLEASVDEWKKFIGLLTKYYMRKQYDFNNKYTKVLSTILDYEDKIIEILDKRLELG